MKRLFLALMLVMAFSSEAFAGCSGGACAAGGCASGNCSGGSCGGNCSVNRASVKSRVSVRQSRGNRGHRSRVSFRVYR